MMINMIAAVSQNGYIGVDNKLPWNYPEDKKLFASKTRNSTIIMGRKTFETINRKPLPKRRNLVISRLPFDVEGIEDFENLQEALDACDDQLEDIWIVGGERVYTDGMKYADEIHLTIIPEWTDVAFGQESARFPWINPLKFEIKEIKPLVPEKPELNAMIVIYKSKF